MTDLTLPNGAIDARIMAEVEMIEPILMVSRLTLGRQKTDRWVGYSETEDGELVIGTSKKLIDVEFPTPMTDELVAQIVQSWVFAPGGQWPRGEYAGFDGSHRQCGVHLVGEALLSGCRVTVARYSGYWGK